MSPTRASASTSAASQDARRSRRAAQAIIGPLALGVGLAVAAPTVINLLGLRGAGGALGPAVAFMSGANFVQVLLALASAALFVLAGAKLLGPQPDEAWEEFAAALVVLGALWVSLLRSTLYRSILPWSFRFAVLVALLTLLGSAVVLFRLFGQASPPPAD